MLNEDEKLLNEEKAQLVLASLPKSYINIVQTLLIGREPLNLDQSLIALRENDTFMVRCDGEEKKSGGE